MELNSYALSYVVKSSICHHIGFDRNMMPINPRTGHPLEVKSLKSIVYSQLEISEDTPKGGSGCVFPFAYDKMYSIHDTNIDFKSSGVIFIDLDHISQQEISNINSSFAEFTQYMPDLLCMHLSYSGNGFHLYFVSNELNPKDYLKWQIATCIRINKTYEILFGNLLPNTIFDAHQTSIKQRFYLNRPKDMRIQWNDSAIIGNSSMESLEEFVNKNIDYYDIKDKNSKSSASIYTKWKALTYEKPCITNCNQQLEGDISVERKNVKVRHLSHEERMKLYSSLRVTFKDNPEIVSREWNYCMHQMEYLPQHKTQLQAALDEPSHNYSWKTYSEPHISKEFYLFYTVSNLKETKCEDKDYKIETNKEPNLTEEERMFLEKYM